MILVADSGSTKCDWKLVNDDRKVVEFFQTRGFNPFFESSREIFDELQRSEYLQACSNDVTELYYFGAGCSSPARKEILQIALRLMFRNADVVVEHDLLGAALATCDDRPGIACILGTGSNAGFFDGRRLDDDVHALGYLLGDEGSGSYFGKKLLADYLYNKLPPKIREQLESRYDLDKERIFDSVYKNPKPNIYLASFGRFLSDNQDHYYVRNLVMQGLLEFIDIHVCRFPEYQKVPVHFVGSIAYFFEDILRNVAERKGLIMGKIVKEPIHNLTDYLIQQAKLPI